MKKIVLFLLFSLFAIQANLVNAQTQTLGTPDKVWSYPVVYKYNEKVTWYFDLSSSGFAENQDLFMWIWSPSEPDAGNWENSSDFAKLKYEGNMIWSFTLTPTEYFKMTEEQIKGSAGFWMRLKNKNGSQQSEVVNVTYTDFSSFLGEKVMFKTYPAAPTADAGMSILFNSNMVAGFDGPGTVHFHSGVNDWDIKQEYQAWLPEIAAKTQLKDLENGLYKMDLIPKTYYGLPDDYAMQNITFLFVKQDWAANSGDQVIYAGAVVPPPPPALVLFPKQISKRDLLGIIRTNNESGVTKLIYTVTAGAKKFTGEFVGTKLEIKGFINIVTELEGIDVKEIHLLLKDNKDKTILDTNIPLKQLD